MFSRQASWKRRRRTTFRPPDRPDCHSPPHRPHSAQRTRPATGVRAELQRRRRHQHSFMEAESTPERIICVQPPAQPVRLPAAPIRRGWCAIPARRRTRGRSRGSRTPTGTGRAGGDGKKAPRPCRAGHQRAPALPARHRHGSTPPAAPGRLPSPTNAPPTTTSGAFIKAKCTAAAVSVSVHIPIRQTSPKGPRLARRKAGVAVPAIRKKIIAWSSRSCLGCWPGRMAR